MNRECVYLESRRYADCKTCEKGVDADCPNYLSKGIAELLERNNRQIEENNRMLRYYHERQDGLQRHD